MIDQPKDIRTGEELDLDRLGMHLKTVKPEWDAPIQAKQFPAGFSNLTYWLQIGDTEYVLRRPPFQASAKGGHDMYREYNILDKLHPHFPKVPQALHYCEDDSVLGAPFYIMERVEGVILRNPNQKGFAPLQPAEYQQIASTWLDTFVELHQLDYKAVGLGDLGRPAGYVERQVVGWSKRYEKSKTDEVPEIDTVMKWLNVHLPKDSAAALIHNDYKYDNIVFAEGDWSHIIAILDWEMSTLGDPLLDLGTSLAYWVDHDEPEMARLTSILPTYFEGNPTRAELLHQYSAKSGQEIGDFVFPYVYGLFKLTVVLQQIYYRYAKGYTQDPRFANLNHLAKALCEKGLLAIDRKRITDLY